MKHNSDVFRIVEKSPFCGCVFEEFHFDVFTSCSCGMWFVRAVHLESGKIKLVWVQRILEVVAIKSPEDGELLTS